MTERTHDKELDALKADIANLREEIAGLAANARKAAAGKREEAAGESNNAADAQEDGADDDQGSGAWVDLLRKFAASRNQGEKVVKGIASEVEHNPLLGIVAAFGLGFIIAKVWYQDEKQ
jgi:septal ring factor EnvC (AmiA/AmiB activator)